MDHTAQADMDPGKLLAIVEEAVPMDVRAHGRILTAAEQQNNREAIDNMWEQVRRWLWNHPSDEERNAAAHVRGGYDATALHLMCKFHNPPADIIQAIVEAAPEVASLQDSQGWLPLHHICANGAQPDVMTLIIDAYPEGRTVQDKVSRTPLHFYVTRTVDNPNTMAINARILSDSGAAQLSDQAGLLPFHYSCAYGTHPLVLQVLAEAYPASLTATEGKGRTALHRAMVNANRDATPKVIRFLLDNPRSRATINVRDKDGYLPLHLLALGLRNFKSDDNTQRQNVSECLSQYLDAKPEPAVDFLATIQDLPDWLQDTAVVSKHVRDVLNEKIAKPLPTSILLMDGYMIILLILCFGVASRNHIDIKFAADDEVVEDDTQLAVILLIGGASYFLLREIVQIVSLISLGSFNSYLTDPTNLLDIAVITMVYYFAYIMFGGNDPYLSNEAFRTGCAFTQGILYVDVIVYLKSTYVDFAVFVGGVMYVVKRLTAFLTAVGVILLAFAQMFYFIYYRSPLCDIENPEGCRFPHCTFEDSLLKVYTMMMGEIGDELRYHAGPTQLVAQILYVCYAFVVVILLSNVLIAIVTDSYEIIQNDRASIVFWSNRLDFVAEMDAITYGLQRRLPCFGSRKAGVVPGRMETAPTTSDTVRDDQASSFLRGVWQSLMDLFDSKEYSFEEMEWYETWLISLIRFICVFLVIPIWIILGAVTVGWLWPPQVREALFIQRGATKSRAELERSKLKQLKSIQTDLKIMKNEIAREMTEDREEMIRMKTEVESIQNEVLADLLQIKELMASLLGVSMG